MAVVSLTTIKNWFKKGLKPTETQFANTWDSFFHKETAIPMNAVQDLEQLVNSLDGVLRDMGGYNASSDLYPSVGGSGLGGEIRRGNFWEVTTESTTPGLFPMGTKLRAKVHNPGQDPNNWDRQVA